MRQRQITAAIMTLHYCISWMSLHAAHIMYPKERSRYVIAANVRRNDLLIGRQRECQ